MKKKLIGFIALAVISVTLWAQQEAILRDDHPDRYTVVKGDTLWDISNRFLNNPWMWPEIWYVNPQIENPHLIFPGDDITLIYLDDQPRLTVERSEARRVPPGTVKLSPSVHVVPLDEAIPAIPLDAIEAFLSRSRIVSAAELEEAPYVVAGSQGRLLASTGDSVYARGEFPADVNQYGVYRRGDVYTDPETGELLGVQALDIGSVSMKGLEGDIATTEVTRVAEEMRIKDRLLTQEERAVDPNFFPSAPDADVDGVILAVEGGVTQVGKMSVVVINRGEREGLAEGNVLAVYKRGETTRDPVAGDVIQLPDERAGLLMVFRSFEKLSLGLVLEADRPLRINDKVRNP